MNAAAELNPCFVLYPEQAQCANGSRCWNWFKGSHQKRSRGEPSIIADMTREIIGNYAVDRRRVYVAGLSSGGAMPQHSPMPAATPRWPRQLETSATMRSGPPDPPAIFIGRAMTHAPTGGS